MVGAIELAVQSEGPVPGHGVVAAAVLERRHVPPAQLRYPDRALLGPGAAVRREPPAGQVSTCETSQQMKSSFPAGKFPRWKVDLKLF